MSPGLKIAPIRQETVQDKIYAFLRSHILYGHFEPGQKLKLADLAGAFGTSVMPVREALNRLVAERALQAEANRSAVVPILTVERLADLRRVRKSVESVAIRQAVALMTDQDVTRLREMLARHLALAERDDLEQSVAANHHFHFEIYRMSGSEVLIPLIESLWLQFGPYLHYARRVYGAPESPDALRHHGAMMAAFEARDADAAVRALEEDVDLSFDLADGAARKNMV